MIGVRKILAPGERVVFRDPDNRRDGLAVLAMLAYLFLLPALSYAFRDFPVEIIPLVVWPAYFLPAALFHGWRYHRRGWRLMVTDRRLLARPEGKQGEIIAVSREGIQEVRRDAMNQRLFLKVDGEEISIPFDYEASEERLRRALEPHAAVEAPIWARPSGFLEPGEKIVMRYPASSRRAVWVAAFSIGFMALILAPIFHLLPGTFQAAHILVPMATVPVLIVRTADLQKGRWRSVVTDRRILHCNRDDVPRVEAMDLKEIVEIRRETVVPKLILRDGDGRELAIRCDPDEANRILAAMDRPAWDELPLAGKGGAS